MNRTILFIVQPSIGHIVPVISIGLILRKNNYHVVIAGNEAAEKIVSLNGFKFYVLLSLNFAQGFEKYYKADKRKNGYLDNLLLRTSNRIFVDRKCELEAVLAEVRPHIIGIDQFLSSDVVVIRSIGHKAKLFILQTMFPTVKSRFHPPLNSPVIPTGQKGKFLVQVLWTIRRIFFVAWRSYARIKYLNFDDLSILLRQIKKDRQHLLIEKNFLFNYVFLQIPEFILCPVELEFARDRTRNYHVYLGFMHHERNKVKWDSTFSVSKFIENHSLQSKTIIYCSFGTRFQATRAYVSKFFRTLVDVSKDAYFNDKIFIVACGELYDEFKDIKNDSIVFVKNVDQYCLLAHAKLFITHGGLNSIKEAIDNQVPMIVFPLELYGDQPGNAARVEFHGLGIRRNIREVSTSSISLITKSMLESSIYLNQVHNFKGSLSGYTQKRFLDALENLT